MLKSSDIIRLDYSPDLTQAGIAIASRKLASGSIAGKSIDTRQLQREIAQASGALAFHRYLIEQTHPFPASSNPAPSRSRSKPRLSWAGGSARSKRA